jgi:hypothetical protein
MYYYKINELNTFKVSYSINIQTIEEKEVENINNEMFLKKFDMEEEVKTTLINNIVELTTKYNEGDLLFIIKSFGNSIKDIDLEKANRINLSAFDIIKDREKIKNLIKTLG